MRERPERFDWTDREAVVVPHQDGIAVYRNPDDQIVVRVEGGDDGYAGWEDEFVCIPPQHAAAVTAAILRQAREIIGDIAAAQAIPPKDPTAAERQRRHRDKQKAAETPEQCPSNARASEQETSGETKG